MVSYVVHFSIPLVKNGTKGDWIAHTHTIISTLRFWVHHPDELQEQRNRTLVLSVVPISAGIGTGFL